MEIEDVLVGSEKNVDNVKFLVEKWLGKMEKIFIFRFLVLVKVLYNK